MLLLYDRARKSSQLFRHDILISPPEKDQHMTHIEKLILCVSASEQRRVQMLLTEEELGDRKPLQLLRKMKQVLG